MFVSAPALLRMMKWLNTCPSNAAMQSVKELFRNNPAIFYFVQHDLVDVNPAQALHFNFHVSFYGKMVTSFNVSF